MNDQPDTSLVHDPEHPEVPPYRPFRSRPTGLFVDAVAQHIKATGQPETFVGLYQGRIDRSAAFFVLRKVHIDRQKRPQCDMAPCPRCGCSDKFLEGTLSWFPSLQFCAVIGHCCADNEALNTAEREYKWREKRDFEEGFLLEGLPKLRAKSEALDRLRSSAGEALRIYRQFRKGSPEIHQHLRALKTQYGGQLKLIEILRSREKGADYIGPSGYGGRGSGDVESRDIDFGFIDGQTAVSKDYNPIKELDEAMRVLDSFDARPSEAEAVELIVSMDERRRHAAVAILQHVDRSHTKTAGKLADFWEFFTPQNVERLQRYGSHRENSLPFEISHRSAGGRVLVTLIHRRVQCRLSFDEKFTNLDIGWPK